MKYFPIFFILTMTAYANDAPVVNLHTNFGLIVLELNPAKAPKTVETFLKYANNNFYDDTIFHRVIKNYIVQGGGYTKDYHKKIPLYNPIVNESNNGLENVYGTIAMARSYRDPDSATSQFFINLKDNTTLNYNDMTEEMGYTVFGKVIEGMNVIEKIQDIKTGPQGPLKKHVPETSVIIEVVVVKHAADSTELPETSEGANEESETNKEPANNLPEQSDTDDIVETEEELATEDSSIPLTDSTIIEEIPYDAEPTHDDIEDLSENITEELPETAQVDKDEITNIDYADGNKIIEPALPPPKLNIFKVQLPELKFKAEKIPIVDIIIHEKKPSKPKTVSLSAPDMPSQPDIPDPFPY